MEITERAAAYRKKFFGAESFFSDADPEFEERFENFAFDEVVRHGKMDDGTRFMAILAALIGCQGLHAFGAIMPGALEAGLTPVQIKEIIYQSVDYCGMGRVYPFIESANRILAQRGIELPLPGQANTTAADRLSKGARAQADIFGEGMLEFYSSGPEESRHINRWLAENCFGDYYTRGGLDLRERELVTFCFLLAQGGCEAQLTAHAAGNMRLGNDRLFLIDVISQCLPYVGYPRSLNALRCVNDAAAK